MVEVEVTELIDHLADGRTEMLSAPDWRWRDQEAARAAPQIIAELERLAAGAP